jgi:hypothetical protein
LPHLFTCVDYPFVPNTTNHVEGGTNAQLAGLLWLHRGLDLAKRRVLVAHYLASKQVRKPPRNGA